MLSFSDTSIEKAFEFFSKRGLPVAFLVPTYTGYGKSIMDAVDNVRSFLKINGIHDYSSQYQGPQNKVRIKSYFVNQDEVVETYASLYRPITKNGDPRIWFDNLRHFCVPGNLLAITCKKKELFVFNMSRLLNKEITSHYHIPLSIIEEIDNSIHSKAGDLLAKIRHIHTLGYIESIVQGDTGVGTTLEPFR